MAGDDADLHSLFGIDIKLYNAMEFFKMLDVRLHYKQLPPGFEYMNYYEHCYTNKKLTERNVSNLANILENRDSFTLYPICCFTSDSVAFEVADVVTKKPVLRFRESQLPSNQGFEDLSKYFMKEKNIRLANSIGEYILNRREFYDACDVPLNFDDDETPPEGYIDEDEELRILSKSNP